VEHLRASIDAELAAAESLLDIGRAEDARRRVVNVVAAQPDNVDALLLLARCGIELDEPEQALEAATQAAGHEPNRPEAHILRASALMPLDRADEALQAADTAIALHPDMAAAHLVRSLALFNTYRQREAWTALSETTRLAPEWAEAYVIQATMHHTFGRHRQAKQAYQRALALQPDHAGALEGLAQLALRRGRNLAALQQFGAAAALTPQTQNASAGVDRALTSLSGLAVLTAWLAASVLAVAGRHWVAWPIAAAVLMPYLLWLRFFRRRLPDHLWAAVRTRMGTDPRLRVRLTVAVVTLAAGALVGAAEAALQRDAPLEGILGAVGAFLVIAAVIVTVDVRHTRKRVADGGDALAGLAPDEQANVQVGRLVLRWFRATALLTLVPSLLAAEPAADLAVRAATGTVVIVFLIVYYRSTRRRWQRRPGRPIGRAPALLIPIVFLLVGLLWLVIPVNAFWPGQPPAIFTVVGLVLGVLTVAFLIVWLPILGLRRIARSRTKSVITSP
jgi:tetratricopeptide (TPR) repeat protein